MNQHLGPSELVRFCITTIVIDSAGHDLTFALVQKLDAFVGIFRKVNHPKVRNDTDDTGNQALN